MNRRRTWARQYDSKAFQYQLVVSSGLLAANASKEEYVDVMERMRTCGRRGRREKKIVTSNDVEVHTEPGGGSVGSGSEKPSDGDISSSTRRTTTQLSSNTSTHEQGTASTDVPTISASATTTRAASAGLKKKRDADQDARQLTLQYRLLYSAAYDGSDSDSSVNSDGSV